MSEDIRQLPVSKLQGVGPRLAEKFIARGILSLQDICLHLPLRYEDRTKIIPIKELQAGTSAQIIGRVEAVERGFRYRPVLRVAITDDSHNTLTLRFFHFRSSQANAFVPGKKILCFGDVRYGQQGYEMVHPTYRFLGEQELATLPNTLEPVYPAIDGIGQATLVKIIKQALTYLPDDEKLELIPKQWLGGLPNLKQAIITMHQPPADVDVGLFQQGRHPAQQRLALEELLAHQLSLRRQRIAIQQCGARSIHVAGKLHRRFVQSLPFKLTQAQVRVHQQIHTDLGQQFPMLRLVQGDVGSGKTIVAALAALDVIEAGYQVAVMAPTELLAEQHLANFRNWFEPLAIKTVWLGGKQGGKARAAALQEIASGQASLIVGTHALMQKGVEFNALVLAIIDEQHRFGVHQRLALRDKGIDGQLLPHQLVMTATPIPRTLAMTAYADLDVSVLDELPPGRTPVQTVAISTDRRSELIERIRHACEQGRQSYWVCPLIEENEDIEAQAAQTAFEDLQKNLAKYRIGLLHGRLKPQEKQSVMQDFKQAKIDILVATTIIEVGVDVPNASLMVIENAERLGLAQLHQLRGRVGRGSELSTCVLLYRSPLGAIARERIEVMRQSNDGFVIAEKDLALRGPGELLGTRQTGIASFRVADLIRDAGLLPAVQKIAEQLARHDPHRADLLIERWIGSAAKFASA